MPTRANEEQSGGALRKVIILIDFPVASNESTRLRSAMCSPMPAHLAPFRVNYVRETIALYNPSPFVLFYLNTHVTIKRIENY